MDYQTVLDELDSLRRCADSELEWEDNDAEVWWGIVKAIGYAETMVRADLLMAAVKSWAVHKLPTGLPVDVTVSVGAVTFTVQHPNVSPLSVPTDDGGVGHGMLMPVRLT